MDLDKIREKYPEMRKLADAQMNYYNNTGEYPENAITFESNGQEILDPFHSECMRFPVDPIEYYGDLFLNSDFCKIGEER